MQASQAWQGKCRRREPSFTVSCDAGVVGAEPWAWQVGHLLGWPEQWPLSAEAVSAMQCSDSVLVSLQGEKTPDISQFWAQRAGAGEEGERHPVS